MKLLDTDVLIGMLRERRYEPGAISIITLLEVLRGLGEGKRESVKRLLEESFRVEGLDNEIVQTYCSLYRKLREEGTSLPDADLLIAATAMARKMVLKTGDEHFEKLKGLGLKLEKASHRL
jgi:predicted nucleic acid-binding protein